jgi:hypothetical protein
VYIMGLDLGQARDYSALCVLERSDARQPGPPPKIEQHYAVRHLQRWPLGTLYPAIVEDVTALLDTAPLTRGRTPLVIDLTGVGRAVGDLFTTGGIRPRGVTITAGLEANTEDPFHMKVPKREIVSTMIAAFQTSRLKIAAELEQASALIKELSTMRVKVDLTTGNDSFEHWRATDHDDIALAVGIALWYGEHALGRPFQCAVGPQRIPSVDQASGSYPLQDLPRGGYRPYG